MSVYRYSVNAPSRRIYYANDHLCVISHRDHAYYNNPNNYTAIRILHWLISKNRETITRSGWRKTGEQSTNIVYECIEISKTWLPYKNSWDNSAIASVNNGSGIHALISQPCRVDAGNCAIPRESAASSIDRRFVIDRFLCDRPITSVCFLMVCLDYVLCLLICFDF